MGADHLRVAIFLPGYDQEVESRRCLLHCEEKGYEVTALAMGHKSWASVATMYQLGEVARIVTVAACTQASEPGVEVAGSGRTAIRTSARATTLRRIATLIDSGLGVEEVVRILRRAR